MAHDENREWTGRVMAGVIETLGLNGDDTRYEIATSTDVYASTMYHVTVKFKSRTRDEELAVLLKRPPRMEALRRALQVDPQFHNEILFYRTFAQPGDNFPRCFYVDERPPTDSVIALENVTKLGYSACPQAYNASLEYIVASMREIARFHGKGYVMKERQPDKFFGIVKQIRNVRFDKDEPTKRNEFKIYVDNIAPRSVEYLRRQGHDPAFCDQAEALLTNAFDGVMLSAVQPLEPLSTLCHGDFTLGNTLFKPQDGGKCRGMLIDFGCILYATPVVDLSTYICLGCSTEMTRERFPEIMRAYHDALREYLRDAGIWDDEKYSYDAFLENYKWGGLFGFVIASFYLVMLMGICTIGPEQLATIDLPKHASVCKQAGGDAMSKILADMLLYMRDLGCFTAHSS